ncbi:unnamed protein product [Rotaria magnacalcarata]|uniref:Uncharacterized protein n=1 Tax=Rotaria magnacalcarata TaxID=392030 RepID=A0A816DPU5_9BILA|nr:unnamed protein product [Rotaria magnacalcarata]CAF1988313.1 unnamed protein product [Rotaria magnacalcarata]
MITEKQVEHVIIPMPHEHFVVLTPNITIIILTIILIVFYVRQSANVRQEIANRQYELDGIYSSISLPNIVSNSCKKPLFNRTKSLMIFQERDSSQYLTK